MLNKLNIRNQSLPFDWLNMDPIDGIEYVTENFREGFNVFLSTIMLNVRGNAVSERFPNTEFMHEPHLTDDLNVVKKFERRANRFKTLIQSEDCDYLYNLISSACSCNEKVKFFNDSVRGFISLLKSNDRLLVYLRYNEGDFENA